MNIFTDTSSAGLLEAAEANLAEKSFSFSAIAGSRQGGPNPRWFMTKSPLAGYNGVVSAVFQTGSLDRQIEAACQPFDKQRVPFTWWVGPSSAPGNLGARLQTHGFIHNRDMIGMSAEIERLAPPKDHSLPVLQIEEVTSANAMSVWMPLYIDGFRSPPSTLQSSMEMLASVSFKPDSAWKHFLVREKERVIAIASLFLGGGVAGLYNLVTDPTERGKGIGAAFTLQLFALTREMGYRIATLQTTYPNALRLYHRLGFEVYCKFGVYQKLRPNS